MGIQGLLPFLKNIHKPVNISQFEGCTVAIDAYCWLHKGAYTCADKLALGEATDQYIVYCMKYLNYLLSKDIKPILVLDGCPLPSKKDVETSRREKRELNKKKAAMLLREGKRSEARECLQKCIDVTPEMASNLIKACRQKNIDCIVAPYEADAQLAYLNKVGIADVVITEDSDLLLFGCDRVIFKMDHFGNGILIECNRLNEVMSLRNGYYSFEKFRYMCILSGCDYLPSLPGIGLATANKVFKLTQQTDVTKVLSKLPSYIKLSQPVSTEYVQGFIRADNTFLYQLVFDPLQKCMAPLNPYPSDVNRSDVTYAGQYMSNTGAYQMALGNVNVITKDIMDNFSPPKNHVNGGVSSHKLSIWHPQYEQRKKIPFKELSGELNGRHQEAPKEPSLSQFTPLKRKLACSTNNENNDEPDLDVYLSQPEASQSKKPHSSHPLHSLESESSSKLQTPNKSPRTVNKFAIRSPKSEDKSETNAIVKSRFFAEPAHSSLLDSLSACELSMKCQVMSHDDSFRIAVESVTKSDDSSSEVHERSRDISATSGVDHNKRERCFTSSTSSPNRSSNKVHIDSCNTDAKSSDKKPVSLASLADNHHASISRTPAKTLPKKSFLWTNFSFQKQNSSTTKSSPSSSASTSPTINNTGKGHFRHETRCRNFQPTEDRDFIDLSQDSHDEDDTGDNNHREMFRQNGSILTNYNDKKICNKRHLCRPRVSGLRNSQKNIKDLFSAKSSRNRSSGGGVPVPTPDGLSRYFTGSGSIIR